MKAAKLTEHPSFRLMRQTDVQNVWHMQMPRWLFSDPRYSGLSLDAKVTYTFLLNRFQLSRRNSWVNDAGEVFVIFPARRWRKSFASVSSASRQRSASWRSFKKRCGAASSRPPTIWLKMMRLEWWSVRWSLFVAYNRTI